MNKKIIIKLMISDKIALIKEMLQRPFMSFLRLFVKFLFLILQIVRFVLTKLLKIIIIIITLLVVSFYRIIKNLVIYVIATIKTAVMILALGIYLILPAIAEGLTLFFNILRYGLFYFIILIINLISGIYYYLLYTFFDVKEFYERAFNKLGKKQYRKKIKFKLLLNVKKKYISLLNQIAMSTLKTITIIKQFKLWNILKKQTFIVLINISKLVRFLRKGIEFIINLIINMVLFFKNVILILVFIAKSIVISCLQLFKGTNLQNFKKIAKKARQGILVFIKAIHKELKLIGNWMLKLIKSLFVFIVTDILLCSLFWIKKNVVNFIGLILLFVIIVTGIVFSFNYKDVFSNKTQEWENTSGAIKISSVINRILQNDIFNSVRYYKVRLNIESGQNIYNILLNENVHPLYAKKVIDAISKNYNLNKIKPGWVVNVIFATSSLWESSRVQKISIPVDTTFDLIAEANSNYDYAVYKEKKNLTSYTVRRKISIQDNVYQSALDSGVPPAIISEFFKVLSLDVDFQREVQPRDTMEVVFECLYYDNDELASCNNLLYGSLKGAKKSTVFYKYKESYYHEDGKSASKTLIKTPTAVTPRISSPFGVRIHPVLGFTSFHKGVDFAVPTGTPIYASGNGVVVKQYYSITYGNYMKIKHNPYLETAYAHMNNFASGIKVGDRVKQGQVIGYVGSTGRATGPHLHYEILINNKQVNPLIVKTPSNKELSGEDLTEFLQYKEVFDSFFVRIPRAGKILSPNNNTEG